MTHPVAISLLLKTASDLKATQGRDTQIAYLRTVYNEPLRYVIQGALHPGVEWLLPKGQMIFAPTRDPDAAKFYREFKKLYVFCKGGNDALDQTRRENLFIQMLEAIHPDDADLMIHVKDKYLPYPGLDYDLFCEAYPGILPAREKFTATEAIPENKVFVEVVERTEPLTKEEEKLFKKIPQKSNKGKSRWNNGVENFMVMTEEALAKGFLPGYLKK
jgi:hypothetical protein